MKTHTLKCWPTYFKAIISGEKRFDIRKNDRGYKKGDTLLYLEYDPSVYKHSGRKILVRITYLMESTGGNAQGWKLSSDAVVMGIEPVDTAGPSIPKFTTEKPTKEGIYWYRIKRATKDNGKEVYTIPQPCAISMSYLSQNGKLRGVPQGLTITLLGDYDIYMLKDWHSSEWLGPVNIPEGE